MGMKYIRINIYLSPKQKVGVTQAAKEKDIKFSEAIRQAINEWLKRNQKDA